MLTTGVIRSRLPLQSEMRDFSLVLIQAPCLALLQHMPGCFFAKCVPTQETECKGRLRSQIGPMQTRKGLSTRPPLSTAIYRFRCNKLPRAVLTSSPCVLYSPPFFTLMTLDSNPIQVSRMNCPEDQDGCGNGQRKEGIHGAVMLATFVPNN